MAPPKLPIKPMRPKPPTRPKYLPPGPPSYIRKGEGPGLMLLGVVTAVMLAWWILR